MSGDIPSPWKKMNTITDNRTSEKITGYVEINLSDSIKEPTVKEKLVEAFGFLVGKVLNCL